MPSTIFGSCSLGCDGKWRIGNSPHCWEIGKSSRSIPVRRLVCLQPNRYIATGRAHADAVPMNSAPFTSEAIPKVRAAVNADRLLDTALRLIEIPSPTCDAGRVANRLAEILRADGFEVERPEPNWPQAPAVVTRLRSGRPGRTLQFDGHLDTVHLPFVAPHVEDGVLTGSGASDMKGGVAASVEALRA